MTVALGTIDPIRTLSTATEGEAMTQLDRTVWTAPVRNLVWVAAQFGHR
jgi:hypothetical protein